MNIIPASEIKRRGISAVDAAAQDGPVHVVKESRIQYVVLSAKDYEQMMNDLAEARLAASEADVKAGRIHRGSAAQLLKAINRPD